MTDERVQRTPVADGERVWIAGEPVWVRYDPDLMVDGLPRWGCSGWEPTGRNSVEVKPYGAVQDATYISPGLRRVIRLRRWDERVYLHEVLHILLGKHYPSGHHAYDHTFVEDPKHEKAVREIEDGLWDMGWRLFDGQSHIDPSQGPRVPDAAPSPGGPYVWKPNDRADHEAGHPSGFDCDGEAIMPPRERCAQVFPPGGEVSSDG